jgi:hypothetical protein
MTDFNDPYFEDGNYEDDSYYSDSKNSPENPHKYYFQFDMESWNNWLFEALKEIDKGSVPVNDYFSSTGGFKHSLYLGNNHYKEPVYKTKYFIHDKLETNYKNHLVANALHFLRQPNYYMGLFDILN